VLQGLTPRVAVLAQAADRCRNTIQLPNAGHSLRPCHSLPALSEHSFHLGDQRSRRRTDRLQLTTSMPLVRFLALWARAQLHLKLRAGGSGAEERSRDSIERLQLALANHRLRLNSNGGSEKICLYDQGQGAALFLIHGMFGDFLDWQPLLENLTANIPRIFSSRRGSTCSRNWGLPWNHSGGKLGRRSDRDSLRTPSSRKGSETCAAGQRRLPKAGFTLETSRAATQRVLSISSGARRTCSSAAA
jgi:hypothetical protein